MNPRTHELSSVETYNFKLRSTNTMPTAQRNQVSSGCSRRYPRLPFPQNNKANTTSVSLHRSLSTSTHLGQIPNKIKLNSNSESPSNSQSSRGKAAPVLCVLAITAAVVHFIRFSQVIPGMNPQQSNSAIMKAVPLAREQSATTKLVPSSDSVLDQYTGYKPAPAEEHVTNHTIELGLAKAIPEYVKTCHIWTDPKSTPYYSQLQTYIRELDAYYNEVEKFQSPIPDLRKNLTENNHQICDLVKLHPDGLPGIFNQSQQLSYTAAGWVEPLISLRHPKFCTVGRQYLMPVNYMLHDFHTMCLKLKPKSRTVFIDMGASLSFHGKQKSPVLFVLDLYRRFGFKFDHIYAYEMRQQKPSDVFAKVPKEYEAAYHWINVGVASEKDSRQNPLNMLLENYDEDDLVIVKLDIDTPFIELPLAKEVSTDPRLAKLIDHFYFEHHVNQLELRSNWKGGAKETVAESLDLFTAIRKQGIAAHYWV